MKIKALHKDFITPTKSRETSGAYDIYMPEAGAIPSDGIAEVPLGFATEIPFGYVGLIFPRSGVGVKEGLELNNTCGVIDADYRGEWKAFIKTKSGQPLEWDSGDRLLQVLFVPVASFNFELVDSLSQSERGIGGFGSSGK